MPTRASTKLPAKRSAARPRPRAEDESDLEVLGYSDDGLTFEARLFGTETFVLSTDINAHVVSLSTTSMGKLTEFFHRQVSIDHLVEGKKQREIDQIADEEKKRFDDLLGEQRGLTFERYGKLFADIIEAAGNDESGNGETST
jgi:hypothetical protein